MCFSRTPQLLHTSGPKDLRACLPLEYADTAHKTGATRISKMTATRISKDAEQREISHTADENVER